MRPTALPPELLDPLADWPPLSPYLGTYKEAPEVSALDPLSLGLFLVLIMMVRLNFEIQNQTFLIYYKRNFEIQHIIHILNYFK